ncbi:hypothetical protein QBC39DRAFT_416895 [Podospora conica]|nr:hypothetical protein QBC39DRAFT_416895 [Schizothecium conicum]
MHLKQIIVGLTGLGALTAAAPTGNGAKGMKHEVREETASKSTKASVPNIPQNITSFIGQNASNQLIQLAEQDLLAQVKAHIARSADLQAIKNNIRLNSLAAQFPRVNTVLVVVTNIVDARNPKAVNKRYLVNSLFVNNNVPDKHQVVYATDSQEITVTATSTVPTPTVKNLAESFTTTTACEATPTSVLPPADASNLDPNIGNDPNGSNNPDFNNPLNNPTIITGPNTISSDPNNPLFIPPTFLPPGGTPGITTIPAGGTGPIITSGGNPLPIPGTGPIITTTPGTTIPGTNPLLGPTTFGNPTFSSFGGTVGGAPAIITTQTITNIIPLTTLSLTSFSTSTTPFLDPATAFLLPFNTLPPTSATALILPSDPANLIYANQIDLLGAACLGLGTSSSSGHLFGSAQQALEAQLAGILQQQGQTGLTGLPPVVLGGTGQVVPPPTTSGGNGGVQVEGVLVNGVRFRVVNGTVELEGEGKKEEGGADGKKAEEEKKKVEEKKKAEVKEKKVDEVKKMEKKVKAKVDEKKADMAH